MDKKYDKNPNTPETLELLYSKGTPENERINDWMIPHLMLYIPGKKYSSILEVGCGFGKTLSIIYPKTSAKLKGVDISPTAIHKAQEYHKGIDFECSNYEHSADICRWDMIICSQTLEHVDNPIKIIERMKLALKENGVLFITVPWPKSNLDNGVKSHYWRFYSEDFSKLLPSCVIKRETTRMIVIWRK